MSSTRPAEPVRRPRSRRTSRRNAALSDGVRCRHDSREGCRAQGPDDGARALIDEHEALDSGARDSYLKLTVAHRGDSRPACDCEPDVAGFAGGAFRIASVLLWVRASLTLTTALGGFVVLDRDSRRRRGLPDRFLRHFNRIPRSTNRGWRRWIRPLFGRSARGPATPSASGRTKSRARWTHRASWPACRSCRNAASSRARIHYRSPDRQDQ